MQAAKSFEQMKLEGHPNPKELMPTMKGQGKPVRPMKMAKEAAKLWDSTVEALIDSGVVTALDQQSLEALCHWWHIFRLTSDILQEMDDVDSKLLNNNCKAWTNYERLMKQFGLSPQARNHVSAAPVDAEADDFFS